VSILIVDDTSVAAKLLELHIKNLGYETVTTTSGDAALAALEAHPDIEAVITDIMMPGMDGFTLIRTINERPEWRSLPIIVATALSDVPNAKQIAQLGVQHYLLKPVDKAQLARTIRAALPDRDTPLISKRAIIKRLDLDPAMYDTLAASFVEMVDESIRLLTEPREPGRMPAGLALSGLHEAASMFGVERLRGVTRRLIDQASLGEPSGATATAAEAELERLAGALRIVAGSLQRAAAEEELAMAAEATPADAAAAAEQPTAAGVASADPESGETATG
jgi:CheY-like chemotaxis protein/HAMP domain-containing protein